jgi:asparagine synthase (glutamine-hydrolysing)
MCGIAGIIAPDHKDRIHDVTEILAHRGPDDGGYYHDAMISLGQRRLSIVDVAGGHQPISNEDGTIQLVCNGEIYNSPELRRELEQRGHTFKTHTDVEVIVHLYEDHGIRCVNHLRGMFALAVWDARDNSLLLARDHLGQKPLFYYVHNGRFAFASEVKSILATGLVEPEIDLNGLSHYMSLRYLPDNYSLFREIQKLPAAHVLQYKNGTARVEPYWHLSFDDKFPHNEEDIVENLDTLLLDTVKSHLLSDVQIGTFLSGGIDSSLITAMMAEITGESFPTFSIGVKEQSFNELPYARMVSGKYNLNARENIVEADMIHLIPSMIHHMDEPSDPFGAGVYLVSRVATEEVKVVLGGDGGDENFAGYDRYAGNKLVDYYCLFPAWFRRSIMKRITKLIPETFQYKSFAQKVAWMNEMSFYTHGERYTQSMGFLRFLPEHKDHLFTDSTRAKIDDGDSVQKILKYFDSEGVDDLVDRMLYTDLKTRMPDHLLAIVDRMAMAHSLESRSPLIDYKVVEFAARIPGSLKLKGKTLKHILRRVASKYLPRELVYREKQGFGFPIGIWMRTELRTFLQNLFRQSRFVELGLFDHAYMHQLLQEHLDGKVDHNFRLWILMNLEIWYRLYFENESVDSMTGFIDSNL